MIEEKNVLKSFKVEPFNSKGEPFNPEYHNAIGKINPENEPEGKIAEVSARTMREVIDTETAKL